MPRGLKLLLATLVVAGVAAGTAAAGVTQNDVKQTLPFDVFVPCANGGAGELVSGTIDLHILLMTTVNGNNYAEKYHYQPQGSDLVGETTGDVYAAGGVTQETATGSFRNGQATDTFVNNFRILGPGPGNNFLVHEVVHVTVNANGDTTAQFDHFRVDCS